MSQLPWQLTHRSLASQSLFATTQENLDYLAIKINWNDATWILTSSFIIFTMQTGFSLLHSGLVLRKNQISVMLKTTFNPIFVGLTYWFLAYGLTETTEDSNSFIGFGNFFTNSIDPNMGQLFASYTYKLSTMSTATNVIAGAMAGRITFSAYFIYLISITVVFALPNYWILSSHGFLHKLGTVDIAGCSFIHLAGGTAGLVATIMLKPRAGRFHYPLKSFEMCDPTNALLGTYMLWWGWVGFHMSSTFGVSNNRWNNCTRSAICTIISSSIGGLTAILFSYFFHKRQINIKLFVCGLCSGLVAISGGCTLFTTLQALLIGFIGSICCLVTVPLLKRAYIDDPVNTIAIHTASSAWGMLAVGLFVDRDDLFNIRYSGLLRSGSFHLLGAQIAAIFAIVIWSAAMSYLILKAILTFIPIRVSAEIEDSGIDLTLNNINIDHDWDKILLPNLGPTVVSSSLKSANKRKTRRRLMKVVNAIIAVNRLIYAGSHSNSVIRHQLKAFNTKVLAQSWSSVRPVVHQSVYSIRPMHTEPHA